MPGISHHEKLGVWKRAVDLCVEIYKVTEGFPASERFGLASQMRRSSVSVASNIAEGAARGTTSIYIQFLNVARGSLAELETQLLIAFRLNFLNEATYKKLSDETTIIGKMLTNLTRSLRGK